MPNTIEKAIKQEFGCYYMADELPEVWDEDFIKTELPRRASSSAQTLAYMLGEEEIPSLISSLRAMRNNPAHPLIQVICDSTLVDWTEEAEDWNVLQSLLDLIADNLEKHKVLSKTQN